MYRIISEYDLGYTEDDIYKFKENALNDAKTAWENVMNVSEDGTFEEALSENLVQIRKLNIMDE